MTWKNPEKWEKMISGEDCDFCSDIHLEENQHSFLVSELKASFIRLPKNQYWKGWTTFDFKVEEKTFHKSITRKKQKTASNKQKTPLKFLPARI
jgi:hypothetical protein